MCWNNDWKWLFSISSIVWHSFPNFYLWYGFPESGHRHFSGNTVIVFINSRFRNGMLEVCVNPVHLRCLNFPPQEGFYRHSEDSSRKARVSFSLLVFCISILCRVSRLGYEAELFSRSSLYSDSLQQIPNCAFLPYLRFVKFGGWWGLERG